MVEIKRQTNILLLCKALLIEETYLNHLDLVRSQDKTLDQSNSEVDKYKSVWF